MSQRALLAAASVLAAFTVAMLGSSSAQSSPPVTQSAAPASPADTPQTIFTDPDGPVIFDLSLNNNSLFYHSSCGSGETDLPRSRVRSVPVAVGPAHDIYFPDTCQPDRVASQNIAVDGDYVYWLTSDHRVVRLPHGAGASDSPLLVATMLTTSTSFVGWITVDNTQVFWSEGPTLYRALKDGSGIRTYVFDYSLTHGTSTISHPVADGHGAVYLLYNGTVFRDPITNLEVAVSATGRGQGFTLGNGRVYWSEKDGVTSQVHIKSAPVATPTTGVTPLTTVDGTGNPDVARLAVDSINLYWHEARSGSGPLQRMLNTGLAVDTMVANMPAPLGLVSNGVAVFWTHNTTILRLGTAATAVTLNLAAGRPPEVIQAVQNGSNAVTEYVAGKETFVRVYGLIVSSSNGLTRTAALRPAAVLHGFVGAVELPGSPLLPLNSARPLGNTPADRTDIDSSYWFRLPASWTSGTVTLRSEINPNHTLPETDYTDNHAQQTVTFTRKAPICLVLAPVATIRGPTISIWDPTRGDERFFTKAKQLLPTNELRVFYQGGPLLFKPRVFPADSGLFALTQDTNDADVMIILSNAFYLFSDYPASCGVDHASTLHLIMVPDVTYPVRRAFNGSQVGNSLFFFAFEVPNNHWLTNTPGGGVTLAHELGHLYGRHHVDCGEPLLPDFLYPYPPCQLDNVGPESNIGYDYLTNSLLLPGDTSDMMSYSVQARWPSDYTWHAIFSSLQESPPIAGPQAPAAGSNTLIVSGMLSPTSAFVGNAYQVTGSLETNALAQIVARTEPTTTYELRLYDALNIVIGSSALRVSPVQEDGGSLISYAFMNWVDYSAADTPTRLAVVRTADNAVMGSVSAGANPPTVTITSPTGGSFAQALTVRWSGSDPDGDPLQYSVRYSPDNGASWMALGTALTGNQLDVPLNDGLPGGAQARVQVLASDGLHTGVATSPPFAVALHAPQAAISDDAGRLLNTVMFTSAQQSELVSLHGAAYDAEDGPLAGAALQWDVSGQINLTGSGDQLSLSNLPPGPYTVKLTGTDSDGSSAVAKTSLLVAPKHVFESSTPTLDGNCADAAYNAELDPIALRYTGVLSVAQVSFAHAGGALWACFSGLQIGSRADSFAGLRIDGDNSGGALATSADLGFFVGRDGVAFTARGDGAGGFPIDALPAGLTAAVSQDAANGWWNAELRIDVAQLGGWNHLVRLTAAHYWRDFTGDDTVWPAGAYYNVPDTWGLASLGQLGQSLTFGPLTDHYRLAAPFSISASASSGLPVGFSSLTPGVCTVLANYVSMLSLGACTIRATQAGNATYPAAAAIDRSFFVLPRLYLPVFAR